jgi:polyhydroxybutyrate depolymerase
MQNIKKYFHLNHFHQDKLKIKLYIIFQNQPVWLISQTRFRIYTLKTIAKARPLPGKHLQVFFTRLAGIFYIMWISLMLISGCTPMLPSGLTPEPGSYKAKVNLRINGFRRTYRVRLPSGYNHHRPLPAVLVIHGAFDTAKKMEHVSGFSQLADRENFIVIYPEGMGIFGFLQHWNAGHCCGKAAADQIDDTGFLKSVIEHACSRLAIDQQRIYMTGFSNGGMLVHKFAAEKGHLIAAAAPLAAAAGGGSGAKSPEWTPPRPKTAVPVLIMHGTSDLSVPFEGTKNNGSKKNGRIYWPAMQSAGFWADHNKCQKDSAIKNLGKGKIQVTTWSGSPDQADVILFTLHGWGHKWPGRFYTSRLSRQDPLYDFDAAEIIWDFFKTKTRR